MLLLINRQTGCLGSDDSRGVSKAYSVCTGSCAVVHYVSCLWNEHWCMSEHMRIHTSVLSIAIGFMSALVGIVYLLAAALFELTRVFLVLSRALLIQDVLHGNMGCWNDCAPGKILIIWSPAPSKAHGSGLRESRNNHFIVGGMLAPLSA